MLDYEVVIVGGGPAGLAAGLYLSQAKTRTILLEKEEFGGYIKDIELIENYPGFAEGVSGARLASEMVNQAAKYGLQLKLAEVTGIEVYSSRIFVSCADGNGYTSTVVIISGGSRNKKLGVPGEEEFMGKGIFSCALCDGGKFADRVVAVCGGGNAGVTEALYMAKLASKVVIIEALPKLTATALLQDRARDNPKIEIFCGTKVEAVVGGDQLEAIEYVNLVNGKRGKLPVDGVLVDIGVEPNTGYLEGTVPLDSQGLIIVSEKMQTEIPYILAAGDIRSGSTRQIATAVGDGVVAAIAAQDLLQQE